MFYGSRSSRMFGVGLACFTRLSAHVYASTAVRERKANTIYFEVQVPGIIHHHFLVQD